jgi:hypothetical protein
MGRYAQHDASERRTARLSVKLTPTEQQALAAHAASQGATPSTFARELIFRRSAAVVAATRRNPEAAELLRELSAIGNNLNQLAHRANETRRIASENALLVALDLHRQAIARVLDL